MSVLRPGLCSALTDKVHVALKQIGINTVIDLITKDVEDIAQKSGIAYKDLQAIRRVVLAQYSSFPQCGSRAYAACLASNAILPTGCTNIDMLLDGGLYTAELTEVAGATAVGKTQFCFSCCVSVACDNRQNVMYLDTCGDFTAERLAQIIAAQGKEKELDDALARVRYQCVYDVFQLLEKLEEMKMQMSKQTDDFYSSLKLLIVDNVASVIYPVLGGKQMDGLGLMTQLSLKLKVLAVEFSLAVLITNNVVSSGSSLRASLGKTWSHVPHNRLLLTSYQGQRSAQAVREAKIIKSYRMACGVNTTFIITEKGLQNPG